MPIAHHMSDGPHVINVSRIEAELLSGDKGMRGTARGDPEGLNKICDLETEAIPAPFLMRKGSFMDRLFFRITGGLSGKASNVH